MKKLLLGCGVLLALGLGSMGFVLWQLWPQLHQAFSEAEEFERRLLALEEQYAFDPQEQTELDPERFAASLDMRIVIGRNFDDWQADIDDFGDQVEDEDLGFVDKIGGYINRLSDMFQIITPMEEAAMSASEFSYHTRVLWATLATVNAGMDDDDPALERLRGHYPKMKTQYQEHQAEGSTPLAQLIGEFEPSILNTARSILKTDPDRVDQAIAHASAEVMFMALPNGPAGGDGEVNLHMNWDDSDSDSDGR